MARNYVTCDAKPKDAGRWSKCNRKLGHTGKHADTRNIPALYWADEVPGVPAGAFPCPHGCTNHTVKTENPADCGHYHSPTEWGHHEQVHNSEYWAALGNTSEPARVLPRSRRT